MEQAIIIYVFFVLMEGSTIFILFKKNKEINELNRKLKEMQGIILK